MLGRGAEGGRGDGWEGWPKEEEFCGDVGGWEIANNCQSRGSERRGEMDFLGEGGGANAVILPFPLKHLKTLREQKDKKTVRKVRGRLETLVKDISGA